MKTEKFLKQNNIKLDEDSCTLCELHEKFDEKIEYCPCPKCDSPLSLITHEMTVIGEHNCSDTKNITKCPMVICDKCGEHVALIPTVVTWNANHDVYYTGEPCFIDHDQMQEIENACAAKMKKSVEQFVERILAGDKQINAFYLNLWMSRDVSNSIAEHLHKYGYLRSVVGLPPNHKIEPN